MSEVSLDISDFIKSRINVEMWAFIQFRILPTHLSKKDNLSLKFVKLLFCLLFGMGAEFYF